MKNETIYLLTDGCLWEQNKRNGTEHPHAIEVVDIKTGAVRFITSGSRITFVEGEITDLRSQAAYNKATTIKKVSARRKGVVSGTKGKKPSKANRPQGV
jgi:hypothetical protein